MSTTVAVTNDPEGALAATADVVLPLHAGIEEGGVACLTFQATLAVLQLVAGRFTGAGPGVDELRPAVDAAAALRAGGASGSTSWRIASPPRPRRTRSPRQSGSIRAPVGADAAGGAAARCRRHRDGRLAPRRRLPVQAAGLHGAPLPRLAIRQRRPRVRARALVDDIAVGADVDGAAPNIPLDRGRGRLVALLMETGVDELAAAELWRRGVDRGDPALVP